MKLDYDVMRQVLLDADSDEHGLVLVTRGGNSDTESSKYAYHADLLTDAGMMTQISGTGAMITKAGRDYLDPIRSDLIWKKTMDHAAKGGVMTLELLNATSIAIAKLESAEK